MFGSGDERTKKIASYRSPKTRADEFLFYAPALQILLAVWCLYLGFASYEKFFSHSFAPNVAFVGALLLCIVIEFGKLKMGGYVFQKLFLEGTAGLRRSPAESIVWLMAVLFAVATFIMSVINSTAGAHSLAQVNGLQSTAETFIPNTADLDAKIAAVEDRIQANRNTKWKGTTTVFAQKSNVSEAKSLESLQKQRDQLVTIQAEEYKRRVALNDQKTATGANMLMAAGGWVECLQVILLIMVAACMGIVDQVMKEEAQKSGGAQSFANLSGTGTQKNGATQYNNQGDRPTIGFTWDGYGDNQRSESVPQFSQSVPQKSEPGAVVGADEIIKTCERALMSDIPNFNAKYAKPESVHRRVCEALDRCFEAMQHPDFKPSRQVIAKFYGYLANTAIPTMNSKGWPYERDVFFMQKLLEVAPPEAVPA